MSDRGPVSPPHVFFELDGRDAAPRPGEPMLQVSLRSGINHAHVCGGKARCSTCRVRVTSGLEHCLPRNEAETKLATRVGFGPDIRLACQTQVDGPVHVRRLVLDDDDVALADQKKLVGTERRLAILFADVRGFTPLSERLPPYDVIHLLNRYFRLVGAVIEQAGGEVTNYMGDGLMALFGREGSGPEAERAAARAAVKAGLGMLAAVDGFQRYFHQLSSGEFRIGVGAHFGTAVVGALGAGNAVVTAIGDAVNVASRVEHATRETSTSMLITQPLYELARDLCTVRGPLTVPLKGCSTSFPLYEVLALHPA